MAVHELKCESRFYQAIVNGWKRFSLRKNDRDYRVGDTLELHELSRLNFLTGRSFRVRVTSIVTSEDGPWLTAGYVALGVEPERA